MSDNRKAWTADEDHAITTLVKKHGTHRWSQISKRMLDHFGPPARTGKQCRQRWHNHLNPKINKSTWTDQEERLLFQCHHQYGNKWKSIAQHLKGRTDNDIKNKFYSSMRKKLRKINKMLGVKNSTSQVRQIKPKVLSNIISAASSENQKVKQAWQQLSKLIFCKDDKKLSKLVKGEDKQKIIELIQTLSQINDTYLQNRDSQKINRKQEQEQNYQKRLSHEKNPKQTSKIKRRISLRKKQTSNNQKNDQIGDQKKVSPTDDNGLNQDLNFNFSLSFADSYSPGFNSSFTPVLGRKGSSLTPNPLERQRYLWRDFLNSPIVTRSFTRTPNLQTPGGNSSPGIVFDFKNNEFGRSGLYDQIRTNIQNQISKNTQYRQ